MKKTLKIAALVAAAVMAMGFVSCSNDDAEDLGTLLIVKDYQEKKEAEAAAAAAAKAPEESKSNVTTDSFDLQNPSSAVQAIVGVSKTNASTGKTSIGAQNIDADITESGASGNLNLVLSAAGTGKGTSIGSAKPTPAKPTFQYVAASTGSASKGLKIKYDALKIEGIKGKVKATVSWYINSKKEAGNRNLEVTVGSGATVSTPNTDTKSASNWDDQKMADYTVSFDGGDDGTTLYIGGSDEICILSIKIEAQ